MIVNVDKKEQTWPRMNGSLVIQVLRGGTSTAFIQTQFIQNEILSLMYENNLTKKKTLTETL